MSDAIPVKYVLFSHYWMTEKEDMTARFEKHVEVEHLRGLNELVGYFRGLRQLLTAPGHEGILVLFYSPGYALFLDSLAGGETDAAAAKGARELRFAAEAAAYVRRRAAEYGIADRLRFITPLDLEPILGRANPVFAANFAKYFTGRADGIRYDAPKVVEAILRLRLVGAGVPVLRIDQDAIFDPTDPKKQLIPDLGLFKPIACAVRAYRLRVEQPAISTFVFSASYDSWAVLDRPPGMTDFEAWSRAFATRVLPALCADPAQIRSTQDWSVYAQDHFSEKLARQYYGLKADKTTLQADGTNGLISIGAHPHYSIISGALLCMSDGAILDLPPFSNFTENVMWIDDFLKYSLHRAMNHFASGETLDIEPALRNARLDDVTVTKARPSVPNVPGYVFSQYLPTLLCGTIMDKWITTEPILKCRAALLGKDDLARWQKAHETQHTALLPAAMTRALQSGTFGRSAAGKLEKDLAAAAVERIEQVRHEWAELRDSDCRTFASYWAAGEVKNTFGQIEKESGSWEGIAPGIPMGQRIKWIGDLSPMLAEKVNKVIRDAVEYVDWTLQWPNFIQMVRSVKQGKFAGDLSWPAAS